MLTLNPAFVEFESSDTRTALERARAGDAEAFSEICRVHETRLLRQAMTLCGNATLAEDLAQDTLIEGWKCLHHYNGRCRLFTWLCAILLNRYRNTLRQKRPQPWSALGKDQDDSWRNIIEEKTDDTAWPDEQAQIRERAALVRACLRGLSVKHQRVIYLRFYVDDSLEGIASALGCSVGTVKSRLFHALEKLRGMKALTAEFPKVKTEVRNV